MLTYLLTHNLFISCIRRYLPSRACDCVMPALSAVLLIFNFKFGLLLFNISLARLGHTSTAAAIGFNTQYRTSDVDENSGKYFSCAERIVQGKTLH